MEHRSPGWTRQLLGEYAVRVLRGLMTLLLIGLGLAATERTALAAATIEVTTTGDGGAGSLRAAIAAAQAGDTIVFAIPGNSSGCNGIVCTITLWSGQLHIQKDLNIVGPGAGYLTVRRDSGASQFRVFQVAPSRTVAISGMTISNGLLTDNRDPLGAGIFNRGTLTLTNSTVSGNSVTDRVSGSGGGIFNQGTLTVENSTIDNNSAYTFGGGIFSNNVLTVRNSRITNNRSSEAGGGVGALGWSVVISGSTISGNSIISPGWPGMGGGGIAVQHASVTVLNSTISNNSSHVVGGGIHNDSNGQTVVINSTLTGNTAVQGAGSLYTNNGTLTVKNSIVEKAPSEAPATSCWGPIILNGANVSDDTSCNMTAGALQLGPLQETGGFSPTQALASGSAAISVGGPSGCTDTDGQPLTTDQRGAPRPQGAGCDLGAYEFSVGAPGSSPPFISPIDDRTILENESLTLPFSVSDTDVAGPSASLTVVARSNRPQVVPDERIVVSQPNGPTGGRILTIRPLTNATGTVTISLTATDGHGQAVTAPFDVTVAAVRNRAPTFVSVATVTVLEDSGPYSQVWATNISPGDPSESSQTLTFEVINNNASLFSSPPAVASDGTLTFTPAPNAAGSATVTVVLRDDGGTNNGGSNASEQRHFTLTVTPVNDRPAFSKGPDVLVPANSGAYSQAWALGVSTGPGNEFAQVLTFQAGANTPGLFSVQPALAPDGTLTFTPAANVTGVATVSVVLKDDGGTENGGADTAPPETFTITIGDANQPPIFTKGPNVTVQEDSAAYSQLWATAISAGPPSESGQTVSFVIGSNSTPALFSAAPAIASNGTLSFTPAANAHGVATLTVRLTDNGGTANGGRDTSTPDQTFTVTITPVDDAPVGQDESYPVSFNGTLNVGAPGVLSNDTDVDSPTLTAKLVTSVAHGSLTLNPDGSFSYTPTVGYAGSDSFTYRPTSGGNDGNLATVTLTVASSTSVSNPNPSPTPSPSPSPSPIPQQCAPRPNPTIQMVQIGPGRLRVTVTAQTNAGLSSNALQQVAFGTATNARVEVPGALTGASGGPATVAGQPAGTAGGFALALPAGTQATTFIVQRQAPGEFKVDLTIVDGCSSAGPFRTFVGGGAGVP